MTPGIDSNASGLVELLSFTANSTNCACGGRLAANNLEAEFFQAKRVKSSLKCFPVFPVRLISGHAL